MFFSILPHHAIDRNKCHLSSSISTWVVCVSCANRKSFAACSMYPYRVLRAISASCNNMHCLSIREFCEQRHHIFRIFAVANISCAVCGWSETLRPFTYATFMKQCEKKREKICATHDGWSRLLPRLLFAATAHAVTPFLANKSLIFREKKTIKCVRNWQI